MTGYRREADKKSGLSVLENETKTVRISIDCMGGDHGLSVTIPASLSFL